MRHLFERIVAWMFPTPPGVRRLRNGDMLLASVMNGALIAQTFDISLSHAEFVKRELGSLPEGAWVGTIRKNGRQVVAVNSKTFYGNQLPASTEVQDAVRAAFR
jgi:hypothetical protein